MDQERTAAEVSKSIMGWFRAIGLLVLLTVAGVLAAASTGPQALADLPMVHQLLETQAEAQPEAHCDSAMTGEQDTHQTDCCRDMNCAHAGTLVLATWAVPPCPAAGGHGIGAAQQISGRSIAPDPGPPKILA